MRVTSCIKFTFLSFILCFPINLWATRGEDDYGIIMMVMLMVYSFPVGVLLICFIIYSISKLRSAENPREKQGNIIFIISVILIVPTVVIPVFLMHKSGWHLQMIEVMLADFTPILIASTTSAILAMFVKNRSSNNNSNSTKFFESIQSNNSITKFVSSKFFIAGSLLFVASLLMLVFKNCFMG